MTLFRFRPLATRLLPIAAILPIIGLFSLSCTSESKPENITGRTVYLKVEDPIRFSHASPLVLAVEHDGASGEITVVAPETGLAAIKVTLLNATSSEKLVPLGRETVAITTDEGHSIALADPFDFPSATTTESLVLEFPEAPMRALWGQYHLGPQEQLSGYVFFEVSEQADITSLSISEPEQMTARYFKHS